MSYPLCLSRTAHRFITRSVYSKRSISSHALPPTPSNAPPAGDLFTKLLNERIIYLAGGIDDAQATSITAQLLYLESQSASKQINVYINSPGGSVTAGLAIYDTIQYIRAPVSTVCLGQACSMASLLLASGTHGKRLILPNATIMVHQPSSANGIKGQATDIEIYARHIINTKQKLQTLYLKHMSQTMTVDEITALLERDRFMEPEEAVSLGLADRVLERKPPFVPE
ncbi:BA75_03523T0 [Komagataella pastoris]|uniref:ATP-dependent Clp protease proteolytic subunit n=1 Tax=Komagataella pastoris TaxID=4922 RepID=A0A1B2JG37_PICPA|nr:BA75_03523T0 [Komagataella pastoris]